jgi:hypothetical protein
VRTKRVGATTLRRRAEQLAAADLRSRDREDDALTNSRVFTVDRGMAAPRAKGETSSYRHAYQ